MLLPGDRGTKKISAVLWPDLEPCALGSGASTAGSGVQISGAVENEASRWQPAVHAASKRGQDAFFPFPVSGGRQFKRCAAAEAPAAAAVDAVNRSRALQIAQVVENQT
jgi:hypothetical protein